MKASHDPFLSAFGERRPEGMTVPEGFFEDFARQMEAQIDSLPSEQVSTKVVSLHDARRKNLLCWSGIAVAAALLTLLFSPLWLDVSVGETLDGQNSLFAETEESSVQEEWLLASVSDYDIYEYFYGD